METFALIVVVLAVGYHIIASAIRQAAMTDYLHEHVRLFRQVLPNMLAQDRHAATIVSAINDLASITGELEKLTRSVSDFRDDFRYSGVSDGVGRLALSLSNIEYDLTRSRRVNEIVSSIEELQRKLVGGAVGFTKPDGERDYRAVTGELENIAATLAKIEFKLEQLSA